MNELEKLFCASIQERKSKTAEGEGLQAQRKAVELKFLHEVEKRISFLKDYGCQVSISEGLREVVYDFPSHFGRETNYIKMQQDTPAVYGDTVVERYKMDERHLLLLHGQHISEISLERIIKRIADRIAL